MSGPINNHKNVVKHYAKGSAHRSPESKPDASRSQMQNLERAIETVSSWPEWKRTAISYRTEESK